MKLSHLLFLALYLFLATGCIDLAQPDSYSRTFFDLEDFIERQMELYKNGVAVQKTVSIEGKTQEKRFEDYNYSQDLNQFNTYGINKPALYEKYTVDSTYKDSKLFSEKYSAINKEQVVRSLEVHYEDSLVDSIIMHVLYKSIIVEANTKLQLIANKGYQIQVNEDRIFGDPVESVVRLTLVE